MFGFLWRSSWRMIILVTAMGTVSGLISAALVGQINSVLSNQLGTSGLIDRSLLLHFSGLCVAVILSGFMSHYLSNRLSEKTICELRIQISRLILNASYPTLQKLGKSRLLANLTEDIGKIADAFLILPELCVNAAMVAGCLAYLGWLSWRLALVTSGVVLFGIITYKLLAKLPRKALEQVREEYDHLSRDFRTLIEGIKELKLHNSRRVDFMEYSLATSAKSYRRHSVSAFTSYLFANQWVALLFYLMIGLILFVFPTQGVDHEVISGYLLVFLFMMGPLSRLTESVSTFASLKIASGKIQKLGADLQAANLQEDTIIAPNAWSKFCNLSLQDVTHSFHREKENRHFVLGPINLEFKPGELVFLIGGNGSGKTTLAMLLIGLYYPENGVIKLNDVAVTDANRDAYLQNFSVVFSDFHLFDELFGFDADKVNRQVIDFLERLHLHHKVSVKNGQFSTLDLSQGQRKRLALLIAYLEDRPFYVFDEWAADQDPEFKGLFYTELLPALTAKGKTVLAITHDDRYFHLADRCIKLEEGQITSIEYPGAGNQKIKPAQFKMGK
ncbi:MAG: cyclic peptide export ABC transporter [Methyloglobulus sp.]|nr:cyclic peptide export ABC transporter [Methyloglobulus sp.]